MTLIMDAIASDMDEYEQLCILYDVPIQHNKDAYGNLLPDCYGAHAIELKNQHLENVYKYANKNKIE